MSKWFDEIITPQERKEIDGIIKHMAFVRLAASQVILHLPELIKARVAKEID